MIVPGSMTDWVQGVLLLGLLAGTATSLARGLRAAERPTAERIAPSAEEAPPRALAIAYVPLPRGRPVNTAATRRPK